MHDTSAYVNLTSLVMPPMTLWSPFFSGGEEAEGVGAEPPQEGVGGAIVTGAGARYPSALCIVMLAPAFDQYLGLRQRVEDLAVEQLISQFTIE